MNTREVLALLRAECEKAGSQRAWARRHKLSAAYVSDVLLGRREPAESICRALGLKRDMKFSVNYRTK